MSTEIRRSSDLGKEREIVVKHPLRRVVILGGFVLVFLALYGVMMVVAVPGSAPIGKILMFMVVWGVCFCLYFVASVWVMMTRPLKGRWRWVELGLILGGAMLFRLMLVNLPPELSPDVWRYLWDARVTLHGYSPYLYAPANKVLVPLWNVVFYNARFRQTPTEYPPGAEVFFLLGYLLNPTNPVGLKTIFVLLDLVTCGALAVLLARKGLDARRVVIYAWSPLPIVEFAIAGHSDGIAICFMVLAVLCALSSRQSVRVLAGICIGLATLARLYPILLLVALVRRRDWGLVGTCAMTIVLGYLPFILMSRGDIHAVVFSFGDQRDLHPGMLDMVPFYVLRGAGIRVGLMAVLSVTHALETVVVGMTVVLVCIQRWRKRMSVEAAALILLAVVLMVYAHVFPWYVTALLPWIALLAEPVWTREKGLSARGLAVAMVWYFTCVVVLSYFPGIGQYYTASNWLIYYGVSFGVMVVGLIGAAVIGLQKY